MVYEPMKKYGMLDDMFDTMFGGPSFQNSSVMSTDIHKKDGDYVLDVEIPGYKKEDITISLYNGNLTISASKTESQEEKDAKGNLIHQERFNGKISRSFYVGNNVRESDVKASYNNGVLTITVPSEEKKQQEEKKYIGIE